MGEVEHIEFQLRRLEPLIMAANAVAIDQCPVWIRRRRGLFPGLLGRRRNRGCEPCTEERQEE
jgi:hypothetical protein